MFYSISRPNKISISQKNHEYVKILGRITEDIQPYLWNSGLFSIKLMINLLCINGLFSIYNDNIDPMHCNAEK